MTQISIKQFAEVEMRVGLVTEAINKEGSEKLIRLTVSFGEETRTIFTGVRPFGFTSEDFVNKKFLFVTNLEYKKMMDEESQGMILAVDPPSPEASEGQAGRPIFVEVPNLPVGSKVR
jgi:methionine--tRNA ligase beta chain